MSEFDCRNELVLRERRGELSSAERTAYAAHLAACEACRWSRQLGRDFDESATLEAGDGERIAALVGSAERWVLGRSDAGRVAPERVSSLAPTRAARRGLAMRSLALAAAFTLLVAAGASAAISAYRARVAEAVPPARAPLLVSPQTRTPSRVAKSRVERAPDAVAPLPDAIPAPAPRAPAKVSIPEQRAESAADRFEAANRARRAGDSARAITLYRALGRDFPGSPEAALAELRLGSLLLESGRPGNALEQFDRHLRRSGALVPEALYGRGRALAAIADARLERRTWQRVLNEFPGSPYAAHARRRLAQLGDGP